MLGIIVLLGVLLFFSVHEREPQGEPSAAADQLARAMMTSVDIAAWDSTHWVRWRFQGKHDYIWDRKRDFVQVQWEDMLVLLHTKTESGRAYQNGQQLSGKAADKAIDKALFFFYNDSFWLNPVAKAFDVGTKRSLVTLADGRSGLKVKYQTGGVTPGDAYVWILGENNRPVAWKMWVQIIPVGGLEASWAGWKQLPTGAWIATTHELLGGEIDMIQDLEGGMYMTDIGLSNDPFTAIVK